jgi:hypothetical protein
VRIVGEAGCRVEIREAHFLVDGEDHAPLQMPSTVEVASPKATHAYLAFGFDGERAWNHGSRKAVLRLVFAAGSAADPAGPSIRPWNLSLDYRLDRFHHDRPRGQCQ